MTGLEPNEAVLAEGRIDEASFENSQSMGYVVVTDKRVIVCPTLDAERAFSIPFPSITSFSEAEEKHRYYVHLRHNPIERQDWVPHFARRPKLEVISTRETFLRFSRRNTAAAGALRERLAAKSIVCTEWSEAPPTVRTRSELLAEGRKGRR